MSILTVPTVLRKKLGEEATDGLVELFSAQQEEQKTRCVHVFRDTLALRIMESEEKMADRIQRSEERTADKIEKLETRMNAGFLDTQKQITGIQTQISIQTRWLIAVASFLAIALKVLDVIFQ